MFDTLTTQVGIAYTKALAKRDEATALLNTHLQNGPDINSDEGVDDAVWKIAAVAAAVFLATGLLVRLKTAIAAKGDAAIAEIGAMPLK